MAVDNDGNVYLVDGENHRVLKFDENGNLVLNPIGQYGSGEGDFNFRPGSDDPTDVSSGIAVTQDSIYVLDPGNNRVQRFTLFGKYLDVLTGEKIGIGDFKVPNSVAVGIDPKSNIQVMYIADTGNRRIVAVAPPALSTSTGLSTGIYRLITQWGTVGDGPAQFRLPLKVALDEKGDVYVLDFVRNSIKQYAPSGKFINEHILRSDNKRIPIADMTIDGTDLYRAVKFYVTVTPLGNPAESRRVVTADSGVPSLYFIAVDPTSKALYVSSPSYESVYKFKKINPS